MMLVRLAQIAQELEEEGLQDEASGIDRAISTIEPQVPVSPRPENDEASQSHGTPEDHTQSHAIGDFLDSVALVLQAQGIPAESLHTPEGQAAMQKEIVRALTQAGGDAKPAPASTSANEGPPGLNQD